MALQITSDPHSCLQVVEIPEFHCDQNAPQKALKQKPQESTTLEFHNSTFSEKHSDILIYFPELNLLTFLCLILALLSEAAASRADLKTLILPTKMNQ